MLSYTTISHSNFFHKEKKVLYHVLKIIKCQRNTCPNFADGAVGVGNAEETENGEKEVEEFKSHIEVVKRHLVTNPQHACRSEGRVKGVAAALRTAGALACVSSELAGASCSSRT